MKILITCAGRRNELISYFREVNKITEIHTSDIDPYAPAKEVSDYFHLVPSVFNQNYIQTLLDICKTHKIDFIFSINDYEMYKLSKNRKSFLNIGTFPVISSPQVILNCWDKIATQKFLIKNGFDVAKLLDKELINENSIFPLVIKPRFGTASIGLEIPESFETFDLLYNYSKLKISKTLMSKIDNGLELLIQEKIDGIEYVVDIINDFKGKYLGCVIKRRLAERGGDASVVVTEHNALLEKECKRLSKTLKHIGNLDTDVIVNSKGIYFIDLNPRFGGAFPFSHHSGVNLTQIVEKILGSGNSNGFDYEEGIITCRTEQYLKLNTKGSIKNLQNFKS